MNFTGAIMGIRKKRAETGLHQSSEGQRDLHSVKTHAGSCIAGAGACSDPLHPSFWRISRQSEGVAQAKKFTNALVWLALLVWGLLTMAGCATPMNGGGAGISPASSQAATVAQKPETAPAAGTEDTWAVALASTGGTTEAQEPAPGQEGYRLGNGDVVMVNVWREPVLSGETFVRSDGRISINLLGDVQAQGRTLMELREEIQTKLSEYIESPVVTVTLKNPTSQKYYVIGEVKSPGEYDLITDLTFLQAIARAGGFTDWASRKNVVVIRHAQGGEERIRINYEDIVRGQPGAENILLKANDTIVVP